MRTPINGVVDTTKDLIDKVSNPTSRAGHVVERAAKMTRGGVDKDVTALQMTKNSPNNQKYTTQDVETLTKLYKDSETKVVITAEQHRVLINDQQENNVDNADLVPQS